MSLPTNLVAYYKMESDGTDSIGANTLTQVNTPTFVTGKVGNAANLIAASSQGFRKVGFSQTTTTDFTVAMWVNVTSNAGGFRAFFSAKQTGGDDYNTGITVDMGSGSTGNLSYINSETAGGTGATNLMTSTAVAFGTWHHIAIVVTSGVSVQLYFDGVANGTRGHNGATFHSDEIRVGTRFFSGSEQGYLDGKIDEVGVWTRALSGSEISQLYNSGSGTTYPFSNYVNDPEPTDSYTNDRNQNRVAWDDSVATWDDLNFAWDGLLGYVNDTEPSDSYVNDSKPT